MPYWIYSRRTKNSYTDGESTYVSNSLPNYPIDPQKRVRTFSNLGITTTTVEIPLSDHNFHDGDLVVYSSVV